MAQLEIEKTVNSLSLVRLHPLLRTSFKMKSSITDVKDTKNTIEHDGSEMLCNHGSGIV